MNNSVRGDNVSKTTAWPSVVSAWLVVGMATIAGAQSTLSDAQVESNVLKALAGASALADQAITTRTVYGTVTLSGSVRDEILRNQAENLTANAVGVQKVIDELRVDAPVPALVSETNMAQSITPPPRLVLQSDGTYAPAETTETNPNPMQAPGTAPGVTAQRNDPEGDRTLDQQMEPTQNQTAAQASSTGITPSVNSSAPDQTQTSSSSGPSVDGRQRPQLSRRPAYGYPPGYPPPYGYPQRPYPPPPYSSSERSQYAWPPYQNPDQGQVGGKVVTVPSGTLIRVRVNRTVSSDHSQPGSSFDGVLVNDIIAGGDVAIPRGATVQGRVVDSKSSGTLKGRGELSIELTDVVLGGKTYPIQSDVWSHHGGDKTIETIDKTAGFGAAGALIGALGGGGVGAAVGGGVGAAVGLGSSAASGRGQVVVPPEGVVTFHLAQNAQVTTVSEQEMQRLAYGAGPNAGEDARNFRRSSRIYVGPAVYPYPYGYGYPPPYYGPYGYPVR